jgi:hypothetical protein
MFGKTSRGPSPATTEDGARQRGRRVTIIALALGTLATLGAGAILPVLPAGATSASPARTPSQGTEALALDVYQVSSSGSLIPVDPRSTPDSSALFSAAGTPLGATWGQWRTATGSSLALRVTTTRGPATDFKITVGKLIPGGIYSLFYDTFQPDSRNPVCPPPVDNMVELTARYRNRQHPAPGSFVADSAGGASFHARVAGDLLAARTLNLIVIYDFSGKTYGPVPNQGEKMECRSTFGVDAMRQMAIVQKFS